MSDNLLTLLCAVVGSGAATAIVNFFLHRKEERERIETGESQGMRWLLQDRLEHVAQSYLESDHITYDELKNWNKGHHIYHDLLGGNGDLNALKQALNQLYMKGETV